MAVLLTVQISVGDANKKTNMTYKLALLLLVQFVGWRKTSYSSSSSRSRSAIGAPGTVSIAVLKIEDLISNDINNADMTIEVKHT
jgi:hypothetical protein